MALADADHKHSNQHTAEEPKDAVEHSEVIFQAIGVIVGEVNISSSGEKTITINGSTYQFFYIPRKVREFELLAKEIETTGNHTQRLLVYPRVMHFPRKEQPYQISFQLLAFDRGQERDVYLRKLKDFEFHVSGLWQFIPVCRFPCISIFRNFSFERLEYIKQAEPMTKVQYMKASHVPVLWKDALVEPFKFNPKAEEDQGHPMFVSIKAKFIPQKNVFSFDALLSLPQETLPRFLKVSKKDKATAQKIAKKKKKSLDSATSA
ncbi:hypothetical protein LC612_27960 [Nostoc sp. CHAB 5834]|nr:hypothetical protein [Nostoc sp. CHAB 5834]